MKPSQDEGSDYWRACIDDYLGVIAVGNGDGLVLGDEPLSTTWWPKESAGMFVRWWAANDESAVIRCLEEVPESIFEPTSLRFRVKSSQVMLFDASLPGDSLRATGRLAKHLPDIYESLVFKLVPGAYTVETASYMPDEHTTLWLHRLRMLCSNRLNT